MEAIEHRLPFAIFKFDFWNLLKNLFLVCQVMQKRTRGNFFVKIEQTPDTHELVLHP